MRKIKNTSEPEEREKGFLYGDFINLLTRW